MLYIKLALTGIEPVYVLDYRRLNPTFPHESTGDQFYDEAQFEAYRRLGECSAENLFRREFCSDEDQQKGLPGLQPASVEEWFGDLARNLMSDADPVFKTPPVQDPLAASVQGQDVDKIIPS